jgi:hypothetical protein
MPHFIARLSGREASEPEPGGHVVIANCNGLALAGMVTQANEAAE